MVPRIIVGLALSVAVSTAACRTVKNVKLDKSDQSASSIQFLPWTADQQSLMKASCSTRFAEKLGANPVAECDCLVTAAATRWAFDTYSSNEDEYLGQLLDEGIVKDCGNVESATRKSWQAPQSLRLSSDERFSPLVSAFAMNPVGDRIIAVWVQDEEKGSKASVFAKAYREDTGWAALRYIDANDSPTSFSGAPGIAFLDNNVALVTWQKDDGMLRSIWSARFNGGNWENPTRLELDVTQSPQSLVFVAHAGTGQAAVAWTQLNGVNQEIWVRRYVNGQWQPREVLDAGTRQSFTPALHFTAEGELLAVWVEARAASDYHVVSNRFSLGKWAGPQTIVSTAAEFPYSPVLASAPDKTVALTWLQDTRITDPLTEEVQLTTKVVALMRTVTGAWQAQPTILEKEKGGDGFKGDTDDSLQLGFDGKGIAHAIWQRQEGTISKLWTARAENFKWNTRELLYPNIPGVLKNPKVAYGKTDLIIGFEQDEGTQHQGLGSAWQGTEWEKATPFEDIADPISLAGALWHQSGTGALLWTAHPPASGNGNELFISFYK